MLHRRPSPAPSLRQALIVAAIAATTLAFSSLARSAAVQARGAVDCSTAGASTDNIDADPTRVRITFTNECGVEVPLAVDLAADFASQERGLMNDATLPADQGELFVFNNVAGGNEVQLGFWMEDTPISLSIAFIGKDLLVRDILDMQAETLDIHIPSHTYLYAVEAHQGWFANHEIAVGSQVDLTPALSLLAGSPGQ